MDEIRLIKLHPLCSKTVKLRQEVLISGDDGVHKIFRIFCAHTAGKLQQGEWTDHHRFCRDAQHFRLRVLVKRLCSSESDLCLILDFRYHIVIVGVKPFFHGERFHIAPRALVASGHCKVGIQLG